MFSPCRILVTGAGGFVGGHLLAALRASFPQAELTTPTPRALDVADREAVDRCVASVRPDACVHLAAVAAIPAASRAPDQAWRVNLHGTLAVADALMRHAPDCVFLYPSSADAYGRAFKAGVAVDEKTALSPLNVYGATKAAAEMALSAMAAAGLRVVVLRPFNHTGPGQSPDFVVAAFARQVARIAAGRQSARMEVGALEPRRDFLDVRDVCRAYTQALRHADRLEPGSIINIASGDSRRVGDVLSDLLAMAGIQAEVSMRDALLRPTDIAVAYGNAGAARTLIGWEPTITWQTTLHDVLADWRMRVAAETAAESSAERS